MAFTTVGKCSKLNRWPNEGETDPIPFFYPEDISILMSQPDAYAVATIFAEVGSLKTKSMVLLAVKLDDQNRIVLLDSESHLAALGCFPFNHKGGVFMEDPIPPEESEILITKPAV